MTAVQSIEQGALLHERFRIGALVGEGGMGAVYRAVDEATGETVAVKVLKNTVGAQATERFLREAQVLAGLDHPGIVRFRHVGTLEAGGAFLVMEWLEGEDLAARLTGRGVTFLEAVRAVRGVAEALVIAHGQGLVHRDVKPQNIFLVGGRTEHVKILDFGIARGGTLAATLTDPGMAMGTPAYMAPEQATGGARVDARADLFSLGCVIYECLAGSPPFFGDSPIACLAQVLLTEPAPLGTVAPGIPKPLETLVMRLLSKDPQARPDSAAVVARELGSVEPLLTSEGSAGAVSGRHVSRFEKRVASIVVSRDIDKTASHEDGATLPFAEVHSALTPAQEVVGRRGGSVNVLWDGTVLGVFTGTGSAGDLARAAASAALELRARTPDRALAVATDLANVLGTSATGVAVSRAFGLAGRSGVIRIDATTRALVGETFVLRGTEGGCELVTGRDASQPESRQPVLGRAREIGILNAALDSVREDEIARSVVVVGPAGQGKSSVVRAFLEQALKAAEPPRVVRVACDPARAETSFFVATDIVRRALSISPTAAPAVQRLALRRGLSETGAEATFQFLEHAMGLDAEGASPVVAEASYDPRLLAERTLDEWLEVLRLLSRKRVLLLVIEDLHACDGPSAHFLDRALAELAEQSVLVVATARPEVDEAHPRIFKGRLVDRIQLAPLPRRAADALVRAHLGASAAPEAVARIVEHGAGNPLFLLELSTAAGEGLVEPPASIVALLQERLERLESNARRVLRAASVFGESFWQSAVEALVGKADAPSVAAWLEELTRRDLVQRKATSRFDGEAELGFRHALVRDAAYASLTDADLLVGHRLAASWLEARGEPDPASIARHYALGQEPLQAARHWTRAAALAFEHNDLPRALELVRRVEATALPSDAAERAAFDAIAVKAGYWSGQLQSTIERAEKALEGVTIGTPAWREIAVLFLRASATEQDPRMSRILEDLSAALEKDPSLRRPTEALGEVTMALLRDGDRARAERTIALFGGDAATPLARAFVSRARSWVAMFDGDVSACIRLDNEAAQAFEEAGHRREALAAHGAVAYDWMLVGEWEKARDGFVRIAEKAQAGGMEFIAHNARHNLGFVLLRLGDAEKCVEIQRHSISTATEERKVVVKYSYSYLSKALEALGRNDEALEAAKHACEGDTFISVEAMAATLRSRVARAQGDLERSLELAARAKEFLEQRGVLEEGEQEVRNEWAKALLAAGRVEEAREAARIARDAVLEKAAKLQDEATRASFVSRIPEHREALDLAERLLSEDRLDEAKA